jgi:hypothetical protein
MAIMSIENYIRMTIRHIISRFGIKGHKKNIEDLISRLKANKKYSLYPFKEYPPTIANYSFFRKSDLQWFNFYYSVYGKPDHNFISVPVYLYTESRLNDRMLLAGIKEKNFYNKFISDIPTPATILRRINGFYYDDKFNNFDKQNILALFAKYNKLLIKPSVDSGAGQFIFVFDKKGETFSNGRYELNSEFLDKYNKDFIIQEFITQHTFFSQFNPSCNNTIKVFVYRSIKDDSVNILHSVLWVGAKGHFLDHDHFGGFGLSINEKNRINTYAIDVNGNKYESVNNISLALLTEVPGMDEIRELAKKIAGSIYYGRLLAIDFTVNNNGSPLLLEVNCRGNSIHQYQMHNGGLFKEFTKEILDYCEDNQPRFVIRI